MASSYMNDPAIVRQEEAGVFRQFVSHAISRPGLDPVSTLAAIPRSSTPSYAPLATLATLLDNLPGRWPALDLLRTHTELWTLLPEAAKAGHATGSTKQLLEHVEQQCKLSYTSLLDLFHARSDAEAIIDPETGRSARHHELTATVANFQLPLLHTPGRPKPVVAISLPNGPLLAMTVLATATYYTAAPVAHGSGVGAEQFKTDVLQSKTNMVLATAADIERLGLRDSWLADARIRVLLVSLTDNMCLLVSDLDGRPIHSTSAHNPVPNRADDIGIMLFTSGTSGKKKLVPLLIHSMVAGVSMVVQSWGLNTSMRCLNQMPLNHVGGLIRNLFSPVMSGGSVICCTAFDANLFWDCVEDYAPTWYYASPSMHQVILEAGAERPESVQKSRIQLICNAAGGLLPSLAIQLRDTFSTEHIDCTVLPSYGMTECMPISTPPLNYRLEKTGTSGISVGPEIAIMNGRDQREKMGEVGRVCVRGAPVFGGYLLADNVIDKSCFTPDGWFDTGDMGYMDAEGFLYITGRSKEVINRGGELISPFEVEEAIVSAATNPDNLIFGRISKALAFSVNHDVLQEVVGIAVVTPEGNRRADLRGIQEAVKSTLSQVKAPVLIVYMDGGLPTNNNKILRIKLAERLSLPTISDSTPQADRYYQARSPPPNTPLGVKIGCDPVKRSFDSVQAACRRSIPQHFDIHIRHDASEFYPELVLAPRNGAGPFSDDLVAEEVIHAVAQDLDGFDIPLKVLQLEEAFPRNSSGDVDDILTSKLLNARKPAAASGDLTKTEAVVVGVFSQVLAIPEGDISSSSDFFELGGDSMGAGRLLNLLRKSYPLRLPINLLFTNSKVSELAALIDEKMPKEDKLSKEAAYAAVPALLPGCEETHISTHLPLMLLQLVPLVFLYPMKRALTWTIFMLILSTTQKWPTNESIPGRLVDLVLSITIGRLVTKFVVPLIAIIFKWVVIGTHKEGLYPMWGSYHTRWWLVQKVLSISGMGVWGWTNTTRVLFLRCLGAKIGSNVTIAKGATFGEWDLITIEDNAVLERCLVRPFAAERNTSMYLGRIRIGANASVGNCSTVAAGTTVPANACIGPNSSSWEISDADEGNRDLAASKIPAAHPALTLLLGLPVTLVSTFVGMIPWLGCLTALVAHEPNPEIKDFLKDTLVWFSLNQRVAYHYCALAANAALGPIFFFAAVLVFKKLIDLCCGSITPTHANSRSQMTKFRMQLFGGLMPAPQFHKLTQLFGTHYEATSVFARAMGAKVGKRVYWPGTGPTIQNFELIDIGNDVVFGSRSHMVTSDGTGTNFIRVGSGSMVADRVVLLPGVQLGSKAVMGSGALTKRGKRYASGTTWVGSKKGDAMCLSADTASLPPTDTHQPGHGRMASRYNETVNMPPNYHTLNSTATTLVRNFDSPMSSRLPSRFPSGQTSHRSSIQLVEQGPARGTDPTYAGEKEKYADVTVQVIEPMEELPTTTTESSPFGRAFYEGKANYRVWSQFEIFLYSTFITIACATFWNVGSISAVQVVGHLFRTGHWLTKYFLGFHVWYRYISLYAFFTCLISGIMTVQSICVLLFLITAKWVLMGQRTPGNYDWDKSSYCQRWQLFLKLEVFRRHCYSGNGILGMLTGTHWIVMYFRALGANIGNDCALFAGGLPSLMFTEPDLLTLEDRVSVDDASLVGHINSRGKFDLNPLFVGARSVLRSGSRLLSGARMEQDTCLLEHTLIMAGEVVDAGCTSQGWPAEDFTANRMPSMQEKRMWVVNHDA